MSAEQCRCGRPLVARPGELEPTCGECRSRPGYCDCSPVTVIQQSAAEGDLPPLDRLLTELGELEEDRRRPRVHAVIRALAPASVETQQSYRHAIVGAKHIRPGDWREALTEAKRTHQLQLQEQIRSAVQGAEPSRDERLHSDALDITEEPEAVRLITDAILAGRFSEVYLRGDQLVQVTTTDDSLLTRDVDEAILRRLVADHLPCVKRTVIGTVNALPLPITCKAILALPHWPKMPRLRGVATFPVPLPDGSILQQPGYDPASGLYLREGIGVTPIPETPTAAQTAAAAAFVLDKFLQDFPWMTSADKANAVAVLLTPLLRELVRDVFPFPYVTAPERGSGKTLFASLVKILYGGSMRTLPRDEKEVEKTITSALRGASPVIVFDNIPQDLTIKSPALAALLTMRAWTARILGGSRDGTWPNDRLWLATGTNISLGGDFAQRSVRIAMDYGKPNPDLRRGFAIPDIEAWTAAHRGDVLRHLLILIRAWQLGGSQRDTQYVMRGYTNWAQTAGGILAFHGIEGFLANREEVSGHDEDDAEMTAFLRALKSTFGSDGGVTAKTILDKAATDKNLRDALPSTLDGGPFTPKSLGKLMSGHQGKWYGRQPKLSLRRRQDAYSISWWRVEAE